MKKCFLVLILTILWISATASAQGIQVASKPNAIVAAVQSDGSFLFTAYDKSNDHGPMNNRYDIKKAKDWTNLKQIAVDRGVFGVLEDGRLLCSVDGLKVNKIKDVSEIATFDWGCVIRHKNEEISTLLLPHPLVAKGKQKGYVDLLKDIDELSGIARIWASRTFLFVLRDTGEYQAFNTSYQDGNIVPSTWETILNQNDIEQFFVFDETLYALKKNRTVLSTDADDVISNWSEIVALSSVGYSRYLLGLKIDGTLVSNADLFNSEEILKIENAIQLFDNGIILKVDGTLEIANGANVAAGDDPEKEIAWFAEARNWNLK